MNIHNENIAQGNSLSDKEITITEQVSPAELKQCNKCKEYKELDSFYTNKRTKDGKYTYCKRCHGEKVRAWNKLNPGKQRAYNQSWQKENQEKYMLTQAKSRAKKNKLPFNLELEDIQIPERCPILGILLEKSNGPSDKDSSPSLDKIDPRKGYVKGNVQVISTLANRMKQNATFAQMVAFANWVKRQELLGTAA